MPQVRHGRLDGPGLAAFLELLSEPTPATFVGTALKLYRERGWAFEQAWAQVMRALPRSLPEIDDWRASFYAQKDSWRAAYERPAQLPVAA